MTAKTGRLEMRLLPEQRSLLEQAAAVTGQPIGTLVRNLLMERVREILERDQRSTLPLAQFEAFLQMLDTPPRPSESLVRAAKKYAKRRARR